MTGRYTGKVALITGGASGLGLAVARQMSAEGAHLVLVDWDASSLDAAADGIQHSGGEVRRLTGDVSEAATATAAIDLARSEFGRLDVLFNNAGIDPLRARSVIDTEISDWDRILAVNVTSAYLMSRAAIPLMREGGGGSIVNTASITHKCAHITGSLGFPSSQAMVASPGNAIQATRFRIFDSGKQENIRNSAFRQRRQFTIICATTLNPSNGYPTLRGSNICGHNSNLNVGAILYSRRRRE